MINVQHPIQQTDALGVLERAGAFCRGHFVLSSGLHSSQYFQMAVIFERSEVAEAICRALAPACRELKPTVVVSPAMGAVLFGYELSRALGLPNIYAERPSGKFELRRGFHLQPGDRVLLAENVITTGGSVLETAELVHAHGAELVGYAVVVDRSAGRFSPPEPVIAYASVEAETYEAEDCPLCREGVPLVKPGSRK